jgi:betaine-aldehyde dehydrogenase
MQTAENYIHGQWVKDYAAQMRGDSIDPATGEVAAHFVAATVQEVDAAIASARAAFETTTWAQQPKLRSDVLRLFADRLEQNKAQVVQTLVQLNGKLQREAEGEVMAGISELRYYAGLARNLFGRVIEMEPRCVFAHRARSHWCGCDHRALERPCDFVGALFGPGTGCGLYGGHQGSAPNRAGACPGHGLFGGR